MGLAYAGLIIAANEYRAWGEAGWCDGSIWVIASLNLPPISKAMFPKLH